MDTEYDIIIIGAGIIGSATAYNLSKTRKKVLLLEQFSFMHHKGSSQGQERIIRKTYTDPLLTELMKKTFPLWANFEKETNNIYYLQTGGLDIGPESSINLRKTIEVAQSENISYKYLTANQLNKNFPAFNLPETYYGIFQKDSGIILASKALRKFQEFARKSGVRLADHETVVKILHTDTKIVVETTKNKYSTQKLILTPGTWANVLLQKVGLKVKLKVWKITFAYWQIKKDSSLFNQNKFPVFIAWENNPFYGFPVIGKTNSIKIAPHFSFDITDFRETTSTNSNLDMIELTQDFIERTLNNIMLNPINPEICWYSMTPDENFLIDFHPDSNNIIIATGFSGHGFKFAPLIGKILTEMALTTNTGIDIRNFQLNTKLLA